jgi:hypothetical protein
MGDKNTISFFISSWTSQHTKKNKDREKFQSADTFSACLSAMSASLESALVRCRGGKKE